MKLKTITIPLLAASLAACSAAYPPRDTSTLDRINDQLKQAATPREKVAPLPDAVSSSLLPPLRKAMPRASSRQLEQRFDLVVTDAPVNKVLTAIVTGTRYSIMIKPKNTPPAPPLAAQGALPATPPPPPSTERMTVSLKDVTVFEALDAIREVYGFDYTVDGNRIYVSPPELQTRLYQVNYIIGQRRGVSDLQVVGGASSSSGSSSGSGSTASASSSSSSNSGSGSGYSSIQASALSTIAKSDVWGEIEDALRTTLGCQIPKNVPMRSGTSGAPSGAASGTSSSATSSSTSRADVSYTGDVQSGERQRGVDGCTDGRAMAISQMSGTILVSGMPNEHRMIARMLHSMQLSIERQVIIEAKIIDVELNAQSQQGINWAGFQGGLHRFSVGSDTTKLNAATASGGGAINAGTSLGELLGAGLVGAANANAFSAGLGMAMQFRNFSALINFLQTQGNVHVLSSPRIATLNSQKAVLKVGSEEPFVTNISGGTTTVGTGPSVTTPPTLIYQPFFSGISLDVTPKIDDKENITLHVHSMVNSIVEKQKISLPTANAVSVPFAVNTISETDSVVKTKDGQVVVIGGLMTERVSDNRSKVPGVGDVPGPGALFSKGAQSAVKRELVILLKPTIVKDDSVWTAEIAESEGRIGNMSNAPAEAPR
ncbi:MAG: secretin N-terminal domain-containing protein [Proteobacteria bacterium]|nr:secretin N-terminal domain-containing protein [Pseudomonadota bacterium]